MKFTVALSALLVVLPLLTDARAVVSDDLTVRAFPQKGRGRGGFGGNGGANNANKGGANNKGGAAGGAGAASSTAAAAAASSSAAVAASSTSAAAAAASSVAATGQAQNPAAGDNVNAAQSSLTLDPSQVQKGLEQDGQAVQEAGQVPSLTSSNNFINFCLTQPNLPLTNGQQVIAGSCNPTPMGVIIAQANMPSSKFVFPTNGANIDANTAFTITMAVANMETGNFVNANSNYFAAPQQVNAQGLLVAHSHVVVESIPSLTSTTPTNPTKFAFFKGLNAPAANGVLTADVTAGLPAGTYRLASINTAANHQPALVAVAQHGSLDDMVYFTVGGSGSSGFSNATSTDTAAADATATAAAAATATAAADATATDAASATATDAANATATAATDATASAASATASASAGGAGAAGKGNQQTAKGGNNNQAAKGKAAKGKGRGRGRGRF